MCTLQPATLCCVVSMVTIRRLFELCAGSQTHKGVDKEVLSWFAAFQGNYKIFVTYWEQQRFIQIVNVDVLCQLKASLAPKLTS